MTRQADVNAITQRSMESFAHATQLRNVLLASQQAARLAAQSAASAVPNDLQVNGLQVADGTLVNASATLDVTMLWSGASAPTQTQVNSRTQVEIQQTHAKANLTWNTFNVGRETNVHFNQAKNRDDQAKEWIALNRITDPNAKPSNILGGIKAEGRVYLIKPTGFRLARHRK